MAEWDQVRAQVQSRWQQAREQVQRGIGIARERLAYQRDLLMLRLEANSVRGNIRRKTRELGELTLRLHREGQLAHPTIASMVQEITDLENKASEVERRISELRTAATASR
jgi:predicted ribosome quality control (RQC) complex YloA/Tae2 family protein